MLTHKGEKRQNERLNSWKFMKILKTKYVMPKMSAAYLLLRGGSKSLDLFLGKNSLEQRSQMLRASRNLGPFSFWEKSLEQRSPKLGASRNMGAPFF